MSEISNNIELNEKINNFNLSDKFNILSFNGPEKKLKIFDMYNYYLENFILNKKKSISPSLIHQCFYKNVYIDKTLTKEEIFNRVKNIFVKNISLYMKRKRKEFRVANKKGNLDIFLIIDFIDKFIGKIKNVVYFLDSVEHKVINAEIILNMHNKSNKKYNKIFGNSEIITLGLNILCSHILSDIIVTDLIKETIVNEDKYNFHLFKEFSTLMKNIGCYYEDNMTWYKNILRDILGENIPNNNYSILKKYNNKYFINLYNFSDLIGYYKLCYKRFKFIDDKIIFSNIFSKIELSIDIILNCKIIDEKHYLIFITNFLKNYKSEIGLFLSNKNENIYKFTSIQNKFDSKNEFNILYSLKYYELIMDIILNYCSKNINKIWVFEEKLVNDFSEKESIDIIIKILNKMILKNRNNFTPLIFDKIFHIISKTNLQDYFALVYKKYLIERLLNEKADVFSEREKYFILCKFIKKQYTFNILKVINDYENSQIILNDYKKLEKYRFKFNIITTSYKTWDINLSEGNLLPDHINSIQCSNIINFLKPQTNYIYYFLNKFSNFYKLKYSKYNSQNELTNTRKIIFYPHVGNLDLTFHSRKKDVRLLLLPIHGILLELISNSTLHIDSIIKIFSGISNYNKILIKNIIQSLVNVNILINNNNIISLNLDYNDKDEINVIDVFFNLSSLDLKWELKRLNELAHSRETILSTIINSYLKSINSKEKITNEKLLQYLKNNLKHFEVTDELINKTLKKMEKMEYIKFSEDSGWTKLLY